MGAAIGSFFAALNRFGMRRFWRAPQAPLNVVVTGATKGLGKALAREFLRCFPLLPLRFSTYIPAIPCMLLLPVLPRECQRI